ncbi:hypothetical protein [Oceanidesulfovibrio marinus]|nr:hypothetical protein [Oceanidesulfovibrio marinus]
MDVRQEVEQAVAEERAAHQKPPGQTEQPTGQESQPRDKAYYDLLRKEFDDNHMGDAVVFRDGSTGRGV